MWPWLSELPKVDFSGTYRGALPIPSWQSIKHLVLLPNQNQKSVCRSMEFELVSSTQTPIILLSSVNWLVWIHSFRLCTWFETDITGTLVQYYFSSLELSISWIEKVRWRWCDQHSWNCHCLLNPASWMVHRNRLLRATFTIRISCFSLWWIAKSYDSRFT